LSSNSFNFLLANNQNNCELNVSVYSGESFINVIFPCFLSTYYACTYIEESIFYCICYYIFDRPYVPGDPNGDSFKTTNSMKNQYTLDEKRIIFNAFGFRSVQKCLDFHLVTLLWSCKRVPFFLVHPVWQNLWKPVFLYTEENHGKFFVTILYFSRNFPIFSQCMSIMSEQVGSPLLKSVFLTFQIPKNHIIPRFLKCWKYGYLLAKFLLFPEEGLNRWYSHN